MGCFTWLLLISGFIFIVTTLIRWFDETSEAVDQEWWDRVGLLIAFPFGVWFYPTRVGAGRATPVPRHEPVRGFGTVPKSSAPKTPDRPTEVAPPVKVLPVSPSDEPPPGTPKEFLGMPKIPPQKPRAKSSVDREKLAKLKQKMREQGMLPPED
jgi:hypothetical protein